MSTGRITNDRHKYTHTHTHTHTHAHTHASDEGIGTAVKNSSEIITKLTVQRQMISFQMPASIGEVGSITSIVQYRLTD